MEIKQLIPLDKWIRFHQYDLQMNQFGKFRCREPYTIITDNNYIKDKFGIFAENKLYSYALWLENITRRIRHIRHKEFHQIVNNGQKMQPLYLLQIDRSKKGNINKIFISSLFVK
jgi:hypothetical protein